jgi:hypothetical protein
MADDQPQGAVPGGLDFRFRQFAAANGLLNRTARERARLAVARAQEQQQQGQEQAAAESE